MIGYPLAGEAAAAGPFAIALFTTFTVFAIGGAWQKEKHKAPPPKITMVRAVPMKFERDRIPLTHFHYALPSEPYRPPVWVIAHD